MMSRSPRPIFSSRLSPSRHHAKHFCSPQPGRTEPNSRLGGFALTTVWPVGPRVRGRDPITTDLGIRVRFQGEVGEWVASVKLSSPGCPGNFPCLTISSFSIAPRNFSMLLQYAISVRQESEAARLKQRGIRITNDKRRRGRAECCLGLCSTRRPASGRRWGDQDAALRAVTIRISYTRSTEYCALPRVSLSACPRTHCQCCSSLCISAAGIETNETAWLRSVRIKTQPSFGGITKA